MKLDYVGRKKTWFTISAALVAIAIVASFVLGVKLDVQFSGGSMATYSFTGIVEKGAFGKVVSETAGKQADIREQQDVNTGLTNYVVTFTGQESLSAEVQEQVTTALESAYPENDVQLQSVSNVSASIGRDFFNKSMAAVALALVLMIVYIGFRFRKMDGVSAGVISVIALVHDSIIAYGVFVICGFPLNDSFIAVILTILGYSINNTIIIYDRIRENKHLLGDKTPYGELVNISIQQSMRRSINTTASTVIAMLCVCVVSLVFNVQTIITFSLPLLVGMLAGFFSSVFLAGPLWCWWQERKLAKA